jgi:hypothetical protein
MKKVDVGKPWWGPIAAVSSFRYSFLAAHLKANESEKRPDFHGHESLLSLPGGGVIPSRRDRVVLRGVNDARRTPPEY